MNTPPREPTVPMARAGATAPLVDRGRALEALTLGWNAIEAIVAIASGIAAGSVALVGFGIDSVIESLSGGVLLWRLQHGAIGDAREETARRLVGGSFLLLATYVTWESIRSLALREPTEVSVPGIVLAALSVIVMPLLAREKRRVARALGSAALEADSRQTDLCAWLSAILLGGLLVNAVFAWWWADPVAALAMVPIIAREGVQGLRGRACGDG